ncbi:MAG: glycerophosphodiester phosphodiesterase family protein [Ekhidna sp.]|uniref:glycerophosphodiester phosphodiesterase n=1 Tax=Ekhidna sp. TaxID=2608089 RepID=UPI0032EC1563
MTKKFLLYSAPFFILFGAFSLFEPWFYRNIFASTSIDRLAGEEFQIIAHKGASGLAPENTMAAFQKALDLGVDQIELDVRNTRDEQIVVFHDERLDRIARDTLGNPITGDVHSYTLEELRQFDVGSWYDSHYADQRIPTLKEVLDLINGRCKVLIEIKHMDHPHYHDFAQKLVDVVLSEKNGEDWILLQSYEPKYLDEVHELDPLIQTKALIVGEDSAPLIAFYLETRIHMGRAKESNRMKAINPQWETLSPRRVFQMHAKGYQVHAYPVNTREDMIKMLNAGVDGIITDYPNIAIQLRNEIRRLGQETQ